MKNKKVTAILAGVMAWLMLCSMALAMSVDGEGNLYAEGKSITVKGKDGGGNTATNDDDEDDRLDFDDGKDVYGGWKDGDPEADSNADTSVTIGEGANVGDVYGGGKNGDVKSTEVTIEGGTVNGDVYGGGHDDTNDGNSADVTGSTTVNVNGGTVKGDVYGGGHAEGEDKTDSQEKAQANVDTGTNVNINGGSIEGTVYGGGHAEGGDAVSEKKNRHEGGDADAKVTGGTKIKIDGNVIKDDWFNTEVYGGGHAEGGDNAGIPLFTWKQGGFANADVEGSTEIKVKAGLSLSECFDMYAGGKKGLLDFNASAKASGEILQYKTVTVTTIFKTDTGTELDKKAETLDIMGDTLVSCAKAPSTLEEYYTIVYPDPDTSLIKYKNPKDKTFIVTCIPKTHTVTVTTTYDVDGKSLTPHSVDYTFIITDAKKIVSPQMPSFDGSGNYDFTKSSESAEIQYGSENVTFTVTGKLKEGTVTVTTKYIVEGQSLPDYTVAHTFKITDVAKIVFPQMPTFAGSENYDFTTSSESESIQYGSNGVIFTVTGTLKGDDDDDDDRIPLKPGTSTAGDSQIPLGAPRTGDAVSGLLSILMFAGISIAAGARRRMK